MSPDTQATLGQLGFLLALLPSVRDETQKPNFVTSVITATLCAWMVSVFVGIGFYRSATVTSLLAAVWVLLAYQRYRMDVRCGVPSVPTALMLFLRYFW